MYSQKDEEKYIVDFFKDTPKGKFLDFGGYDPRVFSNTRKLYELGWKGVYLEPSKPQYEKFVLEYGEDEEMTLINKAVSTYDGEITFYNCNDGVSTTEESHMEKWTSLIEKEKWIKESVPCVSINTLLDQYAHDLGFLNIDVEGGNIKLVQAIRGKYFKNVKMICVEHDEHHVAMIRILSKYGFQLIAFNDENIMMKKSSTWTLINRYKSFELLKKFRPLSKGQLLKAFLGF